MSIVQKKFNDLLKKSSGAQLEKNIEELLKSDIYLFNEYMTLQSVKDLNKTQGANKYYNTLSLFANLTYKEYKKDQKKYIQLDQNLLTKLKAITIIELGKNKKNFSYDELMKCLDITSKIELENILFDLISKDIIYGKINAKDEEVNFYSIKPRGNINDISKQKEILESIISNIDQANNFIKQQELNIKKTTKEINDALNL